jgi:nitrogen regulatory protein P-II 1
MKKVEIIIRPGKLEEIKDAIDKLGLKGLTITEVVGRGQQKPRKEVYRGTEYTIDLLPRLKIDLIIPEAWLNEVVSVINPVARTGEPGDGLIFISSIENVIRIRTGETGKAALI